MHIQQPASVSAFSPEILSAAYRDARAAEVAHCEDAPRGRCSACPVRGLSVCAALAQDELPRLEQLSDPVRFRAGETILLEGDPAGAVYNLKAGMVRLYRILPDGRRQIVGFMMPGDFIGLSLSDRNGFSADAVDDVAACRFDRAAYTKFVGQTPHLLRQMHEAASHELTIAQDHMVLLGRRSAEEKVASFLMSQRDRMRRLGASVVTLALPMSRTDLADHLGLTIETVSRVISRLARARVVLVVPNGVRLLDLAKLESLAAS
ncbi:Crp/Fnr family transcriptional regulator [Hansschlegelia zhihuaiae]|uniref:Cyclic nucleotide-binding domain-containing protein n=1 Tax=Hansschlegelia zhihuaiae TaxID=405005 RepID=A0A4Q0MI36_9HYPH|nr:cyclic nucleotide-binding domain-containing protein [Hansschlegelia zhihuaiae]RXF73198.1 cyclic nucleotide-binding domain-containing protein [Hansschlegelia zhihuaiae]